MTRESDIESYLQRMVKSVKGQTRKVKWLGRNGAPDRRVLLPPDIGLSCWVELKKPGECANIIQKREHARMRKLGEIVHLINSYEQIDQLISGRIACSTKR